MATARTALHFTPTLDEYQEFEVVAMELTGGNQQPKRRKRRSNKMQTLRLLLAFFKKNRALFFKQLPELMTELQKGNA